MPQPYSQSKALWAITRASFIAIFNNPISLVFSLLFPILFILIFGAFVNSGVPVQQIAVSPGADTANAAFDSLKTNKFVHLSRYSYTTIMRNDHVKDKLKAIL